MEESGEGAHERESSDSATACTFSFDASDADGSRTNRAASRNAAAAKRPTSNEANLNARLVKS